MSLEEKDPPYFPTHGYHAVVNIRTRVRSLLCQYEHALKKKRERIGREKPGANDSARVERACERADISPRLPRAVDLASLFSLLPVVHRFLLSLGSFSLLFLFVTRFRCGRSVSGNTHAFAHRHRRPERRHMHAGGICYAFRCIEQLSDPHLAADTLFHSIISLTVSSLQSDKSPALSSLRVAARLDADLSWTASWRFFTCTFVKTTDRSLNARTICVIRIVSSIREANFKISLYC